jgi:predicted secreted Zn-dependent protease
VGLSSIFALIAALAAQADAANPAFAGIPNLTVRHYDVSGQSVAAIRKSINAARPDNPKAGQGGLDALSRWRIDYRWETEQQPLGCRVAAAEASFNAEILLPRLVPANGKAIPKPVLAQWNAYIAALEAHEAGYLRRAYEGRTEVETAVRNGRCETAKAAGEAAIAGVIRREITLRSSKAGRLKVKF